MKRGIILGLILITLILTACSTPKSISMIDMEYKTIKYGWSNANGAYLYPEYYFIGKDGVFYKVDRQTYNEVNLPIK